MLKNKTNYTMYEFIYSNELLGDVILLAHTEKDKEDKIWLNIWCKTHDRSGLMHFMVGFIIDNDSELLIRREVERLAECGYFDNSIDHSMEEEVMLEEIFITRMESAEDGENED